MKKVRAFFELIKFEHTVFALPFAYLGMLFARKSWPSAAVFFWTTLAMVSARTAGMTLNRIFDVKIDAQNPRTAGRPSVTGAFPLPQAWIAAAVSFVVLFLSAWQLNPLCLKLAPVAVLLLASYHHVKRFSFLCHFVLGLVLGVAPVGGWLAVTGRWEWTPVLLALAVMFWVAGFDIIYSLQDLEFDRAHGLHSVPVRFGQAQALKTSGACHVAAVLFLAAFGGVLWLGPIYWTGVAVAAVLLFIEHRLVADGDPANIPTAFFTINGWIGILLLVFSFLETFR